MCWLSSTTKMTQPTLLNWTAPETGNSCVSTAHHLWLCSMLIRLSHVGCSNDKNKQTCISTHAQQVNFSSIVMAAKLFESNPESHFCTKPFLCYFSYGKSCCKQLFASKSRFQSIQSTLTVKQVLAQHLPFPLKNWRNWRFWALFWFSLSCKSLYLLANDNAH